MNILTIELINRKREKKNITLISTLFIIFYSRKINIEKLIQLLLWTSMIYTIISYSNNIYINNEIYIYKIERLFKIGIDYLALNVIYYSKNYMKNEEYRETYNKNLYIFIGVMKAIIESNSLFSLYFYWELLGYISYLFIKYWNNNKNAILSILYNKIGDIGMLYFLVYNLFKYRSIENIVISGTPKFINSYILYMLFIKSAQSIGYIWLINAMSAPTPISSLFHTMTIVTSGLFISWKYNIVVREKTLFIYLIIGIIISYTIKDIKKLLAISTSNNLSLLFLSPFNTGFLHMLNHGMIKSVLFLLSGKIIHLLHNQEIRTFKNLIYINPLLYKYFLFLFIPLPFTCLSITKEYILLSSSLKIYLLLLIFSSFYLLSYKRITTYTPPTFNYYLSKSTFSYIYTPILFGLVLQLFYKTETYIIDLLPFIFIFFKSWEIEVSLYKHINNIIYKLMYRILYCIYSTYRVVDIGYLLLIKLLT